MRLFDPRKGAPSSPQPPPADTYVEAITVLAEQVADGTAYIKSDDKTVTSTIAETTEVNSHAHVEPVRQRTVTAGPQLGRFTLIAPPERPAYMITESDHAACETNGLRQVGADGK